MPAKTKVGLVCHFYQPWWQFRRTLDQIVDQCYRPIFSWLRSFHGFAFTANINYSLLELLHDNGHFDILEMMRDAIFHEKVELLGTAAYHPIMPLISEKEMLRQIKKDADGKVSLGFPARTSRGFYLPEYAFHPSVIPAILKSGHQFTIADDEIFASRYGFAPYGQIPKTDGCSIFLRSRQWGRVLADGHCDFNAFKPWFVNDVRRWTGGKNGYVVLATDAETFGHHHPSLINSLLLPALQEWRHKNTHAEVEICPLAKLLRTFPPSTSCPVPAGSWSTYVSHVSEGNAYPLWNSPRNVYHQTLWKLTNLAVQYAEHPDAAEDVLKATTSCFWWWVSGNQFWNPGFMMIGARKAMEIVDRVGDPETRHTAHTYFDKLANMA